MSEEDFVLIRLHSICFLHLVCLDDSISKLMQQTVLVSDFSGTFKLKNTTNISIFIATITIHFYITLILS